MSAFWLGVLANSLGSAVGVGLALLHDRWRAGRALLDATRTAVAQREEAEAAQLRIVLWLVEENGQLCTQIVAALRTRGLFFFRMNTHLLDAALLQLASLCDDQQLLWHMEHYRYQLHHVNNKIKIWSEAAVFQGVPTATARHLLDKQLQPSLLEHITDSILPAGSTLTPMLTTRIQRLSRVQKPPVRPALRMPAPLA